jgi:hypothetical protein
MARFQLSSTRPPRSHRGGDENVKPVRDPADEIVLEPPFLSRLGLAGVEIPRLQGWIMSFVLVFALRILSFIEEG